MTALAEPVRATPRLGVVVLPEYSWARTRDVWQAAEEMGFEHGWTFDHLSWRSLRGRPWFDSLTSLTAVAAVTSRLRLGTLVASPNFRHPVPTAQQVMTLDEISGGRFVFGIGAGAAGTDEAAVGAPAPVRRAGRFEEFVVLSDLLLRQRRTSFHGRHYDVVEADMVPGCVQRPRVPFAIAAGGPRGMRLAARYAQTWVTIGDAQRPGERPERDTWEILADQVRRLDDACAAEGRSPGDLGRLVNVSRLVAEPYSSPQRLGEVVDRCATLGFTDVVVNHPRESGVFAGDEDGFRVAVSEVLQARQVSGRPPL